MQRSDDEERSDRILQMLPVIASGVSASADPVQDIAVLASVLLSFVADCALAGRVPFLLQTARSMQHLPYTPEVTAQLTHLIQTFQAIDAAQAAQSATPQGDMS